MALTRIFKSHDFYEINVTSEVGDPIDLGTEVMPLRPAEFITIANLDKAIFATSGILKINLYLSKINYENNVVSYVLDYTNGHTFLSVREAMKNAAISAADEPTQSAYLSFVLDAPLAPPGTSHTMTFNVKTAGHWANAAHITSIDASLAAMKTKLAANETNNLIMQSDVDAMRNTVANVTPPLVERGAYNPVHYDCDTTNKRS